MKRYLTLTAFLGGFLLLTAFMWQEFSPEADKSTFEEFSALFPEAEFPITADSTFLRKAANENRKINTDKFRKYFSSIYPKGFLSGFGRYPPKITVFAVAKIEQTQLHSAFLYLEEIDFYIRSDNGNISYKFHFLSFNKHDKKFDDYVIATASFNPKKGEWTETNYREATILSEKVSQATLSDNEEAFTISKNGLLVKPKTSGNSSKKLNY